MDNANFLIEQSATRLVQWLEANRFQGWDPHDGLNSPFLRTLGRRNHWVGIALLQAIRHSPINLRPWLGIARGYNPKGMALFLTSFVYKFQATGNPANLDQARFFKDWLGAHHAPGYSGAGWGYNFDWANKSFFAPAGTPTVVNTVFVANALLDYAELAYDAVAFRLARSACDFILNDLPRHQARPGICFSYIASGAHFVHNANILAAALLARVGMRVQDDTLLETAYRAAAFTVAAQQRDGSWTYGIEGGAQWVDNFHTGFILVALKSLIDRLGCTEWEPALAQGYSYWRTHFFRADGAPKYYPDALYPIDIHSVAQAVLTLSQFHSRDADARNFAAQVLKWGIEHMQDREGYFYYQIHPWYVNRIPYMRWSQAWMLRAQAEYLWKRPDMIHGQIQATTPDPVQNEHLD